MLFLLKHTEIFEQDKDRCCAPFCAIQKMVAVSLDDLVGMPLSSETFLCRRPPPPLPFLPSVIFD